MMAEIRFNLAVVAWFPVRRSAVNRYDQVNEEMPCVPSVDWLPCALWRF